MDLGLAGRTALVLGAGGGLGRAIAAALASEGTDVALADVSAEGLASSAKSVEAAGARALSLEWDIGDLDVLESNIAHIGSAFGSVDILVNITGGPPPTPVAGQPVADWSRHFHTMVTSAIAITDRVLPDMRKEQWGRIITSTSSGVIAPIPNLGLSNALRSSLVGWSKTLAREVGRDSITANVVVPGRVATPRISALDEAKAARENRSVDEVRRESTAGIPVGRYGDPDEYGAVVAFLASQQASYVTGSIVRVDGGLIPSI